MLFSHFNTYLVVFSIYLAITFCFVLFKWLNRKKKEKKKYKILIKGVKGKGGRSVKVDEKFPFVLLKKCDIWHINAAFLPWQLPERPAMVMWPPIQDISHCFTELTQTDMSAIIGAGSVINGAYPL